VNHYDKRLYDDLRKEANRRTNHDVINAMNVMADLYRNKLPAEYATYMPKEQFPVVPNLIRNAWDSMAADVGKTPELRVEALDETKAEEKRASLLERIGQSYLKHAEPTQRKLFSRVAWWLVGAGRAVVIVRPDRENKRPLFSTRDPRQALPNFRTVDGVPVELYDVMFRREVPIDIAIAQGLAEEKHRTRGTGLASQQKVEVLEIIDDEAYTIISEFGVYMREEHGLGMCPAWVFQTYNPDLYTDGGLSLYEGQISMMVGVSLLMTMKIAGADKAVNPIYWARGHAGTIKIGPNVLNKLSPSGEMGVLSPPQVPQVDRDIEQLVGFSNILNKNPEVRQGQVDSKGAYQSAKTLEELASALDTTIDSFWDDISYGFKKLLKAAFIMDEKLWPNLEKRITTNVKGKKVRDVYTPKKDINGHYEIEVDYGFGIGGYQGFLQNLQANQAGVRSKKRAMEALPGVQDVDQEQRQIRLEQLDDAQMANLASQAANGQLDMVMLAELKEAVAKGKSLDDAVLDLAERAAKQAAAAAGSDTASITAPAGEPEPPPEVAEAPPPGLNPAAVM
jgi:hypothetical protein